MASISRPAVAALLLSLSLASTSASAKPVSSFSTDWRCREALIAFPVPVENVRGHVPSQFKIAQEEAGVATFAVFAEHCLTRIDDGAWIPHILSGAFVQVEGANYEFLWGTDSREYYKALHGLGVGDFVPGSELDVRTAGGQVNISEASIPWKESPFSFTLVTGEPVPWQPTTSVHILNGKKGLAWTTYVHDPFEVSVGTGVLRLARGTLLADIAGSDEVTGAALFGEFEIENAVTELRD